MNSKYRILFSLIPLALWHVSVLAAEPRPFTSLDAAEMAYFGNLVSTTLEVPYDDGSVSPDGRYALKISHRGVLPDGGTEGTIWLFEVSRIIKAIENADEAPPVPIPLVSMSADINGYSADFTNRGNILVHPRWSDDGKSVYFLGRDGQENRRLYKVALDSRERVALSPANKDVFVYALSGPHIAFLAGRNIDANNIWHTAGDGVDDVVVGTGTALNPLLFPNFLEYAYSEPLTLEVWRIKEDSAGPVTVEPSGEPLRVVAGFADADISISPDGMQAVAVIAGPPEHEDGADGAAYRIIDLETGSFRDFADLEAAELAWRPFSPRKAIESASLKLTVSESANQPPVLVATNTDTDQSRQIFDPNPQLGNIVLLPISVFEWQDQHGRTVVGGLLKPAKFEVGRKYPLVIQTHGFDQNRFYRVGYADTANAGRALASRDIVVLQVEEPYAWDELPINIEKAGLDAYLAAIDKLASGGIIDAEKVGISGYSFTGLTTANSISRAPDRFAAAVVVNCDPLTMTGYFSYVDSPLHGRTQQLYTGVAPFDDDLQVWMEKSPGMNTRSITAPVLISAGDPFHLLSLWDFYAALRYQGKAVELQYIRSGQHNLAKPRHRVAHQEMIVDWFDFWLNEHEDSDPGKVDQYSRWREMK